MRLRNKNSCKTEESAKHATGSSAMPQLLGSHLLLFDNAIEFIAFKVKNCLIHQTEYRKLRSSGYGNARVVQGGDA